MLQGVVITNPPLLTDVPCLGKEAPQLGQFVSKSGGFSYPRGPNPPQSHHPPSSGFPNPIPDLFPIPHYSQPCPATCVASGWKRAHRLGLNPDGRTRKKTSACYSRARRCISCASSAPFRHSGGTANPASPRFSGTGRGGGAKSPPPTPIAALACSSERTLLASRPVPWVPSRRDWDSRMDRPVPSRALGQRPPALSVLATPTPSSGAASTIYVSSAAGAPTQHHQLRHAHPALQSDAGGATLRRGPKRAARGELGAPEESPGLWGSGSAAKPAGPDRNGHGPSPGLGASPDDRDSSTASPTASAGHSRKKQKRNKPTLSCFECVERKTKVCEI